MNDNKKLAGAILWKVLERITVQTVTIVTQIVLARIIEPEKFGSLTLILVFYNIADIFVQKGFGSSIIRKTNLKQEDINSTFIVSSAIAVSLFIIIFFTSPIIGHFYHDPSLINPLRLLAAGLLISPFYCIYNSVLIRNMKFRAIFIRGLIASVVSGIVGIIMALSGFGIWSLVFQIVTNQVIITITMMICEKVTIKLSFNKSAFLEVFSFGKNVLATELLLTGVENIRKLLIGKKYTTNDLAFYDRGELYPSVLMKAINDTLFSTLLPHLSKYQDQKENMRRQYCEITYALVAITMPVFLGLFAVSKDVILILLTEKWKDAIPFMQIFCIYQAIFAYQITSKSALYALGLSNRVLRLEIMKSILSLTLMIISIFIGVHYVAASLIVVRLFSDIIYVERTKKEIGAKRVFLYTVKPIIAAIVMSILILLIGNMGLNNILSLVIKIILGIVVYLGILFLLDREKMLQYCSLMRMRNQ